MTSMAANPAHNFRFGRIAKPSSQNMTTKQTQRTGESSEDPPLLARKKNRPIPRHVPKKANSTPKSYPRRTAVSDFEFGTRKHQNFREDLHGIDVSVQERRDSRGTFGSTTNEVRDLEMADSGGSWACLWRLTTMILPNGPQQVSLGQRLRFPRQQHVLS